MATPGYRTNNGMRPERTPQQQKNVDMKRGEQNEYARQARMSIAKPLKSPTKPNFTPAGGVPGVKKPVYVAPTAKKPGLRSRIASFAAGLKK
jgi:hypothetical protein